jgi:hypothetical protein
MAKRTNRVVWALASPEASALWEQTPISATFHETLQ